MDFVCESSHFIAEYHESERTCVEEVLNLLEERYSDITEKTGRELKQKTTVKICSDRAELNLALGIGDAPEWIRGGIAAGKTVIASPLNPPPGSNYEQVINTVVHEFTHVLIKEINPHIPRWLDEGIASYEGKDNHEAWIRNTVSEGLKNNRVPALADLDTGADFQEFFRRDGYQYSYTVVEYVTARYGYGKLMELVRRPEKLEETFQMTEEEFYRSWAAYLEENNGTDADERQE